MEILILLYIVLGLIFGCCLYNFIVWEGMKVEMSIMDYFALTLAIILWPLTMISGVVGILLAWVMYLVGKRG